MPSRLAARRIARSLACLALRREESDKAERLGKEVAKLVERLTEITGEAGAAGHRECVYGCGVCVFFPDAKVAFHRVHKSTGYP